MFGFKEIERDRELWNREIDWFLTVAPAELGLRGTMGGLGSSGRGDPSDFMPYDDYTLGWRGKSPAHKWRNMVPIWFWSGQEAQAMLRAHYERPPLYGQLAEVERERLRGATGKLTFAVLHVHNTEERARLVAACMDSKFEGRAKIISNAAARAEERVRQAHRMWNTVSELLSTGRNDGSRGCLETAKRSIRSTRELKAEAFLLAEGL